jgi:hypothetical protein
VTAKDPSLKVFRDNNPGRHFNPYYQEAEVNRRLHERGQEAKIRVEMGERKKRKSEIERERHSMTLHANYAPITLPTLKWMESK